MCASIRFQTPKREQMRAKSVQRCTAAAGLFSVRSCRLNKWRLSMPQPWDRPELVREGDANPEVLCMAVGRLLSQWEGVEIQLGYIYAAAVEQHGDWDALRDYGAGTTTARRLDLLQSAVDTFSVRYPDQAAEGRINAVINSATLFAARRHDVAHAIVRDSSWARWRIPPDPRDPSGFFLLPSHYRTEGSPMTMRPRFRFTPIPADHSNCCVTSLVGWKPKPWALPRNSTASREAELVQDINEMPHRCEKKPF